MCCSGSGRSRRSSRSRPRVRRAWARSASTRACSALPRCSRLRPACCSAWPRRINASRSDVTGLAQGRRARCGGRLAVRPLRRVLIAAEVALALILLTGGGLLLQTFLRLQAADLGFDPAQRPRRLRQPAAGHSTIPPRNIASSTTRCSKRPPHCRACSRRRSPRCCRFAATATRASSSRAGRRRKPPARQPVTWYRLVSAGYFDTMGMPLRRGRGFADARGRAVGRRQRDVRAQSSSPAKNRSGAGSASAKTRPGSRSSGSPRTRKVRGARGRNTHRNVRALLADPRTGHERRAEDARRSRRCSPPRSNRRSPRSIPTCRSQAVTTLRHRGGSRSSSRGSSPCCRPPSRCWRWRSRRSASTASWPTWWRSERPRSVSGWRSAPPRRRSSGWSSATACELTAIGIVLGVAGSVLVARWLTTLLFGVTPGGSADAGRDRRAAAAGRRRRLLIPAARHAGRPTGADADAWRSPRPGTRSLIRRRRVETRRRRPAPVTRLRNNMSFFKSSPAGAAAGRRSPPDAALAPQRAHRPAEHREILRPRHQPHLRAAPHQPGYQGGRVRLDHGAVGGRQVHAPAHHRHARLGLDGRVLLPRSAGAQARRPRIARSCTSSTSASSSRAITCWTT